jgi:hypothetical protein
LEWKQPIGGVDNSDYIATINNTVIPMYLRVMQWHHGDTVWWHAFICITTDRTHLQVATGTTRGSLDDAKGLAIDLAKEVLGECADAVRAADTRDPNGANIGKVLAAFPRHRLMRPESIAHHAELTFDETMSVLRWLEARGQVVDGAKSPLEGLTNEESPRYWRRA